MSYRPPRTSPRSGAFEATVALAVLSVAFGAPSSLLARPSDTDDAALRREVDELRRDLDALSAAQEDPAWTVARAADGGEGDGEAADGEVAALGGRKGGVYDKPFLDEAASRIRVGGYFDVEFRDVRGQPHEFRFHRFIPFFYADLHERVHFASELEIEDGSDVAMEFAFLDIEVIPQANFRGGVILTPLGKFNLIHDSPINDLTDRPLVDRFVIPTTMREIGAGLFGTLSPEEWDTLISYEAYVTSGFKGLDNSGATGFSTGSGVRGGRASTQALGTSRFDDNNDSFSGVGRLAVSPFIGSEFGVSAHSGDYDQAGHNNLTITAIDGLVTVPQFDLAEIPVGPIEFQGEGAWAFVERDALATASGIPGDLWGYYAQVNWHFMPAWLTTNAPAVFFPGSTFTFVTRWDQIDLDGNRQRRLTFGLNYRPIESTVLKFDYQINDGSGLAPGSADDDALVISIASFF